MEYNMKKKIRFLKFHTEHTVEKLESDPVKRN